MKDGQTATLANSLYKMTGMMEASEWEIMIQDSPLPADSKKRLIDTQKAFIQLEKENK